MNAPATQRSGIVAVPIRVGLLLRQVGARVIQGYAIASGIPVCHWSWPHCAVDTAGYVVAPDGRHRRRVITFAYDPADPWVVRIHASRFMGGTGWLAERGRLTAALARTSDGEPLAVPVLTGPGESARALILLLHRRDELGKFLSHSYDLVPDGSEGGALASWIDQFAHYHLVGGQFCLRLARVGTSRRKPGA